MQYYIFIMYNIIIHNIWVILTSGNSKCITKIKLVCVIYYILVNLFKYDFCERWVMNYW